MLDIREGDLLVANGQEYPIRSVAYWQMNRAANLSFRRLTKVQATTKRSPGIIGGKRGEPQFLLTGLQCTPLDPADPEIRRRLGLDTPHELLETSLADEDGFYSLVLEDLKR